MDQINETTFIAQEEKSWKAKARELLGKIWKLIQGT